MILFNIIVFLMVALPGLIISALPALIAYRRERRLTKLAKERLRITTAVSEMEEILLQGKVTSGHVCHDELFELMRFVQGSDKYPINWNFFRERSSEAKAFEARVALDLDDADAPHSAIVSSFTNAYYKAFTYRHPRQLLLLYAYLLVSKVSLRFILNSLRVAFKVVTMVKSCHDIVVSFKTSVRAALMAATYRQVNPTEQLSLDSTLTGAIIH